MTQVVEAEFASRLRAWLFAASISARSIETGVHRSTLHRWLDGSHKPTGAVKRLVLEQITVWEHQVAESSVPVPARRVVVKPEPPRPWAQ